MFIVYRIAVEKSRQSRHSATAAGLLGFFAVVFEPYAGVKDVAQQVCVLHAGQAFKALGTLCQQQLKDLFHLFLIAEDKWKDDRSLLGLGYEKLLTGCKQAAESRWPRQCSAIRTCLDRLAEYEAAGSEDLDAVSGCFGELMAELFDYRQDHWSPELRSIGFHLGTT